MFGVVYYSRRLFKFVPALILLWANAACSRNEEKKGQPEPPSKVVWNIKKIVVSNVRLWDHFTVVNEEFDADKNELKFLLEYRGEGAGPGTQIAFEQDGKIYYRVFTAQFYDKDRVIIEDLGTGWSSVLLTFTPGLDSGEFRAQKGERVRAALRLPANQSVADRTAKIVFGKTGPS
jgi:hypothetical protein